MAFDPKEAFIPATGGTENTSSTTLYWPQLRKEVKWAEILFAAQTVESELESEIDGWHGAPHNANPLPNVEDLIEGIRWDYYDSSLEIDGAKPDFRLTVEQATSLHERGFSIVYINHRDGWETIYGLPSVNPERRVKLQKSTDLYAKAPAPPTDVIWNAPSTLRKTITDFEEDKEE